MSIGRFNTDNITRQTSIAMWLSFSVIVLLLMWCFVVPPRGEHAAEILKACTLVYAIIPSAIVREAIKEGKGVKYTHGDASFEVKDKNE